MQKTNSPQKKFTDFALKLLSYRPRSEHEISFRLKIKKASPEQIDQILSKLKKLKFLDDHEFCLWWQRQRDEFRPRSAIILRLELFKKGVSKEIIEASLDFSHETELNRANNAFHKKFKRISKKINQKQRDKIIRFLSSRGFSWSIISQVIPSKS